MNAPYSKPLDPKWYRAAKNYPVVSLLIVLSAMGGMLVSFNTSIALGYFSFSDFSGSQYWRIVTPIFLHFGLLHFVFNSLWLSMLGSRIEQHNGSLHLMMLVLVSGAMSNTAQFWWSGEVFFGGMSGVVYALIGYLWIAGMIFPQPENQLPKGIVIFMIGWLVLCMTPVVTFFIGVGIANAAHLAGLVFGMMLGGVFGLVGKINQHRV
ncbi:MAG TPA: hypothetical protein DCX08_04485 [Porticoccaceae bacterium]|jgi:GlpG protein|nr:hypothetical protein [Porticoccaceae bacterium]